MLGVTRRSVFAGAALLLAACGGSGGEEAKPGQIPATTATDIVYGNPDAPVTLIEYVAITCGACGSFNNTVLSEIKPKYVDTGRVNLITREALFVPPAEVNLAGFAVARCAGDDKYAAVVDDIFKNQVGLFSAIQAGGTNQFLKVVASRHGLDEAAYEACINDPEMKQTLVGISEAATKAGVQRTPTLYLNGRQLRGGKALTVEGLTEILDAELARRE